MWESSDFKILIIQSVIVWATLVTAIVMLARYKGEREETQGAAAIGNKRAAKRAGSSSLKPRS